MAGMYGCFKGRNSDSAAMASGPPDVMANQEPAEVQEECSGKKKSKFQTFKKLFARKKRKEPAGADAGLKASQSSDDVSKAPENNTLTRSEKDKGSKVSLGSKALSHDSVFVSDSSEANEALGASQDSIHGKVKSLQLQLKQAIRLGSPPSLMCVKRADDAGTMSEDDGLPCSPPEYTTPHAAMKQTQRNSSISLEGVDSDDDQLSRGASSRAMSPLVVPGDFSQPASPFACLDNSAAKHKLGLRHKACNRRKPVIKLELKEGESAVDGMLNTSITESLEDQEQQKTEVLSLDELNPEVRREEEEEEKEEMEEEEKEQSQHSRKSLLRHNEEREEADDSELEAEQDISQNPDNSTPPEQSLSEEEAPEAQPLPSSESNSRTSSLDSPSATPEPPAGAREYLLDPPGTTYGSVENKDENELELQADEDGGQEDKEEESSFLQEVLSSLKTPLVSCSLSVETEGVTLKTDEETEETANNVVEKEDEDKGKEEEADVEEPVSSQCVLSGSPPMGHAAEEEEEEVSILPCQEEMVPSEEEAKSEEEREEEGEEEEELVVERVVYNAQEEAAEKEEVDELEPEEERDTSMRKCDILVQDEELEEESETEEEAREVEKEAMEVEKEAIEVEKEAIKVEKEAIEVEKEAIEVEKEAIKVEEAAMEVEKEPEVNEEEWENREKDDVKEEEVEAEVSAGLEETEEAIEEVREDTEEMTETVCDTAEEEVEVAMSSQEADEDVDSVVGDDTTCTTKHTSGDDIPAEHGHLQVTKVQEVQESSEMVEAVVESDEQQSDQEEDVETHQPDMDETAHENLAEVFHVDQKQVEKDETEAMEQATVPAKPSSLFLLETHCETPSQESGPVSPSRTSTIHINLVSPSSEKAAPFFQQSPPAADAEETFTESSPPALAATKQQATATEEEQCAAEEEVEEVEEEQRSPLKDQATHPVPVEETVKQPSSSPEQSKVRFTIVPAWQRSQSLTPPSSPPAFISSGSPVVTEPGAEDVEAPTRKDLVVKAEPASSPKVEVLSPGRVRNVGSPTVKPQSNATLPPPSVKPQTSAVANTEESSVVVEGNPDNPFGVRLRKTSALHLFSSEEANTESAVESPVQPTSCKTEPPQPVGVKPSINHPVSNKPALPKKPDVHGDSGVKTKCISDPAAAAAAAAARGVSTGPESPSWISVAKQKQRIYKESSLDEITVKKEEQERKSSLPAYVSSTSKEQSNKTAEFTGKVSSLELSKPSASVEKEARKSLSPPTPVPPQPSKVHLLPCAVSPKPYVPPATAKHPDQKSLSAPTTVPVSLRAPSCTSPTSLPKPASSLSPPSKTPQPPSAAVTPAPFSSRTAPEKSASRAAGLPGQTTPSQRGLPPPALPQNEPPWMALAKKKAKAWSEMPQIVQ
ncbi:capping protein-inhibiting regulator of actin dynamics-like isoform X3 [Solea solea]|uniref:capping protein-inhibiting regulator of actin dynamics-like isoform X3 n=1 Tax=Solea solea TaxID=90069 RepID=UPI00272B3522|nr:capping protein-inhibiting regulator of actin dynamics-like isoform X3 [Solea solea]